MGKTTNTAGAITKRTATTNVQEVCTKTIKDYIKLYEKEIARALPSVISPERFSRIAMTAVSQNPKLAQCNAKSFIGAMLTSAQLGLEPNTPLGQAYLIPYNNNKQNTIECQFQIGYKGLIDLAHRSGELQCIEAHIVYENDEFEYEFGLEPKLKHKPAKSDRGNMVWAYAMYRLKNGGYSFEVMSKEDIEVHANKYSVAFRKGSDTPWKSHFEEMAKKTVLKKVLKYAPLKTDYARGIADDGRRFDIDDIGEIRVINDDEVEVFEKNNTGEEDKEE